MPTSRSAENEQYDDEVRYEDETYDEDEAYEEDDERADDGLVTTASAAARAAVEQITELTAKQPEGVIAVEPGEDGWRVSVEVVEDRRIPSSADILAIYEAAIANTGDLTSYRRIRRYGRGHGDGGYDQ
ncbi:MAG TPA: gas vesicle protein GvpO [Streptosporangiaceae bacterium]|nr:gas vesicle protein GvpO [Streptosporangiaceae bacterium]